MASVQCHPHPQVQMYQTRPRADRSENSWSL
jgi:hypothetical protein